MRSARDHGVGGIPTPRIPEWQARTWRAREGRIQDPWGRDLFMSRNWMVERTCRDERHRRQYTTCRGEIKAILDFGVHRMFLRARLKPPQ
jgi:hypothetical protein